LGEILEYSSQICGGLLEFLPKLGGRFVTSNLGLYRDSHLVIISRKIPDSESEAASAFLASPYFFIRMKSPADK
jgi:hypothetical protein